MVATAANPARAQVAQFQGRTRADTFAVSLFVLVLLGLSLRAYQKLGAPRANADETVAMTDFREVVYYPAQAVLLGVNPYDNRQDGSLTSYRGRFPVYNVFPLYSPVLFLGTLPLALLPYDLAMAVFWLVNVVLVLVLASLCWRFAGVEATLANVAALSALILLSRPGHANLYFGQVALVSTVAVLAALAWARARPGLSAVALAVASLKPTFGIPVALLMFARRDYRAAAWGLALSAAVATVGLVLISARDPHSGSLLRVVIENQRATDAAAGVDAASSGSRVDAPLVAERLWPQGPRSLTRGVLPLLILAAAGLLLHFHARGTMGPALPAARQPLSDSIILLTTTICTYHNVYDALLVLPPLVWLGVVITRQREPTHLIAAPVMALALAVPAVNYFSSRQFLDVVEAMGHAGQFLSAGKGWLLVSIASGVALTCAWGLLLANLFQFTVRKELSRGIAMEKEAKSAP